MFAAMLSDARSKTLAAHSTAGSVFMFTVISEDGAAVSVNLSRDSGRAAGCSGRVKVSV